MYDIISIGDTTTDVFLDIDEAHVKCDINKEDCQLCINYADKIPAKSYFKIMGVGNAANNAVGSARLGFKTGLYTFLGDDDDGHKTIEILKKEGVSDKYIKTDKKNGTNFSAVLNFEGERTIVVYHNDRKYRLPKLEKSKWIYFTSIAGGHSYLHSQILKYIEKTGAKLAFNPGTHQLNEGMKIIEPLVAASEVFSVNKHEAERLLGGDDSIENLLKGFYKIGVSKTLITDGPNGSYCFDGKNIFKLGIFDVPVVERTGAGDAYTTGFIGALIEGKSIPEAMRWGSFNSSSVIQHVGARAGLLNKDDMAKMGEKYKDFVVEKKSG